jgi:hypothetical protein
MIKKDGKEPAGTVIEMFTQFDATVVIRGGLIPLWLIFNTLDSLEFLKEMSTRIPKEKPIFFSPLATFSITPDLVAFERWKDALKEFQVINIGARESHYPADTRALLDWVKPLRKWVETNPNPIHASLTPDEIIHLAQNIKDKQW